MSAQPMELWRLSPMHTDHLPLVLDIERRAYSFPWSEVNFRDCLNSGYDAWVVESPFRDLLAYAVMSMAADEAHILNLCVAPENQGQGLGRHLLQQLILIAFKAKANQMFLEVRASNGPAINLYMSNGFRDLGLRKGYYPGHGQREDALVLGLNFNDI